MAKHASSDRGRPTPDTDEEIRVGWRMGGIGMEVASQVLAGALLGWLWDKWRGSAPIGITVGSILGIVVGMWSLIRGTLKLNRQLDERHPTKGRGKPLPPPADVGDDDWNDRDQGDHDDDAPNDR